VIFTIAGRELRTLFLSPLAWTILAVVQLILAWLFLNMVDYYIAEAQPKLAGLDGAPGVTELIIAPLFSSAAVVLLLVIPLLTMRLISEERRNRTLPLLLSAPVSMSEIVLGKYLGLFAFLLIMLAMVVLMPLSLLSGGTLDFGLFASALLGLLLLIAAFTAAGLFISTLTQQPTVAGISTFGLLLLLWIIDLGSSHDEVGGLFAYLSLLRHHESLLKGIFNSGDILYYLLFTTTFLVLAIRRLDAERREP